MSEWTALDWVIAFVVIGLGVLVLILACYQVFASRRASRILERGNKQWRADVTRFRAHVPPHPLPPRPTPYTRAAARREAVSGRNAVGASSRETVSAKPATPDDWISFDVRQATSSEPPGHVATFRGLGGLAGSAGASGSWDSSSSSSCSDSGSSSSSSSSSGGDSGGSSCGTD